MRVASTGGGVSSVMRLSYCSVVSEPSPPRASSISVIAIEHLGARLEIGRLEQGLLLARPERAHHAQRVDEGLVRRLVDALPIDPHVGGLDEIAQGRDTPARSTASSPARATKSAAIRLEAHPALTIGRRRRKLLLDREPRDADERDEIAAVAGLGELRDAARAPDLVQLAASSAVPPASASGWIMPMTRSP